MKKIIVARLLTVSLMLLSTVFAFFPVVHIRVSSPEIWTGDRKLANRGLKELNAGAGSNLPEWKNTATAYTRIAAENFEALAAVAEKIKAVEIEIRSVGEEIKVATANFFNATDQLEKQYWKDEKQSLMGEKQSLMGEKQSLMDEKQSLMDEKQSLMDEKNILLQASLNTSPSRRVVRIPEDIPLSKPIDQCTIPEQLFKPKCIVGVEPIVKKCLEEIRSRYKTESDNVSYRKPPLAISRFGRGGKTTLLRLIFNALKASDMDVNVMYINFNNNFALQAGESQEQAALRLITAQLVNDEDIDVKNIVCDRVALEEYIQLSGRPFILLVDELNSLGNPLRSEAAILFREMFLDPVGRYLVFSTHMYLTVDSTVDALGAPKELPSPRKLVLADSPVSFDLAELRSISPECSSLTAEEAQLYGGIPSLIYCCKLMANELSPEVRFNRYMSKSRVKTETNEYISEVLNSLLTGNFLDAPDDVKILCSFASVNQVDNVSVKARWPSVYISLIINFLSKLSSAREGVNENKFNVLSSIATLFEDFTNDASKIGSGMGWQAIVHIAILMRCLQAYASSRELDIFGKPLGKVTSVEFNRLPDVKTMKEAEIAIKNFMNGKASGSIVMFYPIYVSFPVFESFLVYKPVTGKLLTHAIQVKLGDENTKAVLSGWVTHAFLVGGKRDKLFVKSGWTFLSRDQIEKYLGHSLRIMHPAYWNNVVR